MSSPLPSVDQLFRSMGETDLPRTLVTNVVRAALAQARANDRKGQPFADPETVARAALHTLDASRPKTVLNATGVLLHTNLGRAPLATAAAEAARVAAVGFGNTELDLSTGVRGERGAYLHGLFAGLVGAEWALAVNNNAGALFLVLASLARGGDVPISRGELIEIGGSYRLPDLFAAAGVGMVEVGTTNRTRAADYEAAVTPATALILKVHPSNYRIIGFTEEAAISELARLARNQGIPFVLDAGSGLIDDRVPWVPGPPPEWLAGEPGVRQAVEAGVDLVLFSGDKLFGGPQAGIIVGRADLVRQLAGSPVARALRLDGPTLAALTVTAEIYADGRGAELPFWKMAIAEFSELERRAKAVVRQSGLADARIERSLSTPGAGSAPDGGLPSPVIVMDREADSAFLRLLAAEPIPVLARRESGKLIVDLRCVPQEHDVDVAEALSRACRS
ncbi:MAG TPA: L-seryl-tRNA(Sec) selenium transferase [Acidimicrobiia bacterium]|nr:L-seryl-tRNA(Sec) selenium transferase [Acidimicrobiia bacterium]